MRALLPVLLLCSSTAWCQPAGTKWTSVGWGGGGLYWSAAFHPKQNGVVYMGGDVVGVYRSDDHGRTWRHANNGIAGYEVLSLAVDPTFANRVYAATTNGISRSDDGSKSWQTLPSSLPGRDNLTVQKDCSVHSLAVDPSDSKRLAFGTPDGRVMVSEDMGQTWKRLQQLPSGGFCASVAFQPGTRRLYAATTSGLLRFDGPAPKVVVPGRALSVVFARDGKVGYAAMAKSGIYRTADQGKTWSATGSGLRNGEEAIDVVVDPADARKVVAIATVGWNGVVLRSADSGRNWDRVSAIKPDAVWDPTDLEIAKSGSTGLSKPTNLAVNPLDGRELLISANWRPVMSTDGGATWVERSRGADITVATDIRFASGKTYVTAMDEGLFVSDDSPLAWKQLFPLAWSKEDSGHHWRVLAWDSGKQILSTGSPWDAPFNQVFRSLDGGATFTRVRDGLPDNLPVADTMWGRGYPRALAADPHNPYTVYLGIDGEPEGGHMGGGVFKSVDGGWHWQQLPNQPDSRRMFYGLAVDPTDSKRLFWGTCGPKGGLYRSEDGGSTWSKVFDREPWVFNVHVTPDGTVYCPGRELWVSRDHGATWGQLSHVGDGLDIVGLEVDPTNPKRVWFSKVPWDASARGGVYESTDGGATWSEITGDIPCRKPLVLRYNSDTHELWAGSTGLYKTRR